jgi:hypothetical protein
MVRRVIKTQTIQAAINHCGVPRLEPREERYIHLPLPWWRKIYSLNWDEEVWSRLIFAVYWYKPNQFSPCWIIRVGWTYRPLKKSRAHAAVAH